MVCVVDDRSLVLDVRCWHCNVVYVMMVNKENLLDWIAGSGYIQNILPYLTAGERELLISQTCSDCFDKMFPDLDNDD